MNALYQMEGEKVFDFIFHGSAIQTAAWKGTFLEYLSGSELVYEDNGHYCGRHPKKTDFFICGEYRFL